MSDNSFQVYLNSVMTLAQTIVVKSNYVAARINDRLLNYNDFQTDPERPETWKYYMNLAGEYHPTDTVMTVVSSDNLDVIEFNQTNLLRHKSTARDYQFGTRQYGELLERYPGQEDVILGILYPVDKATAIAAPDHTILGYPPNLIESNEYTLVENLQNWTTIYFKRYYNDQYTISDSLYYGVVFSMYFQNLIMAILTERLKKHKTIEAHSFYVSQYLASNSDLGQYYQFMTLEQSMHFYQNVLYYQRHPGSNDTLYKLIDALMTKRLLPMASFSMKHDTTNQAENIYPDILFKRTDMTAIPSAGSPEFINTQTFFEKEEPDAPDNSDELAIEGSNIEQQLKDSPSNSVLTKMLESSVIDYQGALTYKLEDVQVAHWLYWSSLGLYTSIVNVANPKTSERIVLTVKDAYVLAMYAMFKSFEIDPDVIPLMVAERVQRYRIPSDADLKSIVDMKYVDDFSWNEAKRFVVEADTMISIDAFYTASTMVHKSANYQRNLVSYQENLHQRAQVYMLVERYYEDAYVRLEGEGTTFKEWLFSRNLNFDTLDRSEFELLYEAIIDGAIGKTLNTTPSMRNVQAAMVKALKGLSSYTIQISAKIADDETIMIDMPSVRGGENQVSAEGHTYMRVGPVEIFRQKVSGVNEVSLPINIFRDVLSRRGTASNTFFMDLQNGPHLPFRGTEYKHQMGLSRIEIGLVNPPDVSGTNLPPILGMDTFIALTPDQKASLFEL